MQNSVSGGSINPNQSTTGIGDNSYQCPFMLPCGICMRLEKPCLKYPIYYSPDITCVSDLSVYKSDANTCKNDPNSVTKVFNSGSEPSVSH